MTKKDLVRAMALKTEMTQKDVELFLNSFQEVIVETLQKGEEIKLTGFIAFSVTQREARVGRNPKTSEIIQIPSKKSVKAKIGKTLKDAVKEA